MMKSFLLFAIITITIATTFAFGEREHKVHNIILYPEKHSWCQTTPIEQVVASPGYEPVTIDNNICVGACYSYSIPSTQPAEPGELIGPYCDSCQPVETKCYHVTLHSDGKNAELPKTTQKRVQIIMNCSCISCDKIHREDCEINDENTVELPSDLFSKKMNTDVEQLKTAEVPELLHFKPDTKNRIHFILDPANQQKQSIGKQPAEQQQQKQQYQLNPNLIKLLKSIEKNENDEDDDMENYDKTQLNELLTVIEGSENDLNDKNLMDFVNFVNINNNEDLELDLNRLKQVLMKFHHQQHHHHHHHHQLGEEIQVNGLNAHLVKGPHGSMVLAPPPEKLNIDSDTLKPNHDGLVISYENHHQQRQNSRNLIN